MIVRLARWAALALAVAVLVVFLAAQRQTTDVTYGQSPSTAQLTDLGAADDATVPSVAEMTARLAKSPVVRLPGATATWDVSRIHADGLRILVAPPGLDDVEHDKVYDVGNADIRIVGTQVSGDIWQATPDDLAGWRAEYATADVTGPLALLIAKLRDQPAPPDVDTVTWRDPTATELDTVTAALRRTRVYQAPGATLTAVPDNDAAAFPGGTARYVALPRQAPGRPLPRYAPQLAKAFPGIPIVVAYGTWVDYDGPESKVAATTYYAQRSGRLARYAFPQEQVVNEFVGRVADVRYAGLFDRPLPYRPMDPLRVALPALPWLFVACVLVFFALSVRSLLRPPRRLTSTSEPARLAGLTALAVELSALEALLPPAAGTALTRALGTLRAARSALAEDQPPSSVRKLLVDAESDLDRAARTLPGYRPAEYLKGRLV
ncbi:hypothetical protein [Symbioplanes lichenis]|uniref:hypothetical protein n=1 Tax=Symbioplanes lichenis TaxID=1629072 RepID=UPI002738C513|nr:hypothetical protein [Actinoplanes lichenis]